MSKLLLIFMGEGGGATLQAFICSRGRAVVLVCYHVHMRDAGVVRGARPVEQPGGVHNGRSL